MAQWVKQEIGIKVQKKRLNILVCCHFGIASRKDAIEDGLGSTLKVERYLGN